MVKGNGPAPLFVLALYEGLPDDSACAAISAGGLEYLGWGENRALLANIYDALNQNTLVSGQWKKGKEPKFKPWPRPGERSKKKEKKQQKVSLADLHARLLSSLGRK